LDQNCRSDLLISFVDQAIRIRSTLLSDPLKDHIHLLQYDSLPFTYQLQVYIYIYISEVGGLKRRSPPHREIGFGSVVRASEAACAREARLLPIAGVWNRNSAPVGRARGPCPSPVVLQGHVQNSMASDARDRGDARDAIGDARDAPESMKSVENR
jgi:hypothetical protein